MEIKRDVTIKTWDGTWTYHPKVIATPESVEDIVEIVVDEVRFPSPVRPAKDASPANSRDGPQRSIIKRKTSPAATSNDEPSSASRDLIRCRKASSSPASVACIVVSN